MFHQIFYQKWILKLNFHSCNLCLHFFKKKSRNSKCISFLFELLFVTKKFSSCLIKQSLIRCLIKCVHSLWTILELYISVRVCPCVCVWVCTRTYASVYVYEDACMCVNDVYACTSCTTALYGYVCACVPMCMCINVRATLCMHIRRCMRVCVRVSVYMCSCEYVYVQLHTCTCVCESVCVAEALACGSTHT